MLEYYQQEVDEQQRFNHELRLQQTRGSIRETTLRLMNPEPTEEAATKRAVYSMLGSQQRLDKRNLKKELIRYINTDVNINPRAMLQCKCGALVGHLRYKQAHMRQCYGSLVPDGTSTQGRATEILKTLELVNALSDSRSK